MVPSVWGARQYICISSCQHDFSALVCTIYLVYSCVLLCEADPGTVTLLCLCHVCSLPVAVFLLQAVNARDGDNYPEHSLCWGGQGPDTECHHLRWVANPSCTLTDPGLKRLMITWWLMSYLAGEQCCECVKQHGVAAPASCSQSFHCLLVLPHPPSDVSGWLIRIWLSWCSTSKQLLVGKHLFLCIFSLTKHCQYRIACLCLISFTRSCSLHHTSLNKIRK